MKEKRKEKGMACEKAAEDGGLACELTSADGYALMDYTQ